MISTKKLIKSSTVNLVAFLCVLMSCGPDKKVETKQEVQPVKDQTIRIVTNNMDFQFVDTLKSGWNTFHYDNRSNETHFFLLDKYPEGRTIEDTEKEIAPLFQEGMDLINQDKAEEGFAVFGKLPEWFFKVVFVGGSGLVSPKHSSITSLKLNPGYYIMECYVKMPNGTFHTSMGMVKAFFVIDKDSGQQAPQATASIDISSKDGIVISDSLTKGRQIIAVHYKDQIVHENFVGHDINLVKLGNNADLDVLEAWMNWVDPKGLITPAPKGFTFLGGVNDMPQGSVGYFEVELEPGKYALISEVPNAESKNLLKTFNIN